MIASTCRASFSISTRSVPNTLMPTGVRMPVESMSMRALIGMVQALETPGNCSALSISAINLSTVMCARHSLSGLRLMMVSNISVGGGRGAARLAPDRGHLWERLDDLVLRLHQLGGLGHRQAWQRGRHVEQRALVEIGHELGAELCCRPKAGSEHRERDDDRHPLEPQYEEDHGTVRPDEEAVHRILVLGHDMAAHEHGHK